MKLLILTQAVDIEHPILGFFHRWIEEFAKHCEQVSVICLQEGRHQLPPNVRVYSLGKESGRSRLKYVWNFYRLIFSLRKEYDQVFVHMNQLYVLLGGLFWRTQNKKIGLWYAHGKVSITLRIATVLSNMVFTSTAEGFRIMTKKKKIVGQGIDTSVFIPVKKTYSDVLRLITVGRISQSKNIETLLNACAILKERGVKFQFKIVGVPTTSEESKYQQIMKRLVSELSLEDVIEWVGAVPNYELPKVLQQSDMFIHDGSTNSLDKALLEAILCGNVVVSSNPAYKALTYDSAPELTFEQGDYRALAELLTSGVDYKDNTDIKTVIFNNYSVSKLISGIVSKYYEGS